MGTFSLKPFILNLIKCTKHCGHSSQLCARSDHSCIVYIAYRKGSHLFCDRQRHGRTGICFSATAGLLCSEAPTSQVTGQCTMADMTPIIDHGEPSWPLMATEKICVPSSVALSVTKKTGPFMTYVTALVHVVRHSTALLHRLYDYEHSEPTTTT